MQGALRPTSVSTKQQRIAQLAQEDPKRSLTTLAHHMDEEWLQEAYRRTRKDGAVGVDGQSAQDYAQNLTENLQDLLNRAKSGRYYAPPVRRKHIPKGTGKETRPIGIPTFEDKVLQRATAMLLEPIYEQDFLDCSYGFRPGRSAHQALEALWQNLQSMGGGWVIDLDIRMYFDTLDHGHLREILDQRVRDGVVRRLVDKWLKAGVWEEGRRWRPEEGTPQGGVISPLLSNIYLHEVLDRWFEQEVKPRLKGRAFLTRFADDAVLSFEREEDARRVLEVLPHRFAKYSLTIHPEKTRLVRFTRPSQEGKGEDRPDVFDFLGFTHYWGKSRTGKWVVKRKTTAKRFSRSLKQISNWCRKNRHREIQDQQKQLARKVQGHYAYYGITGNGLWLKKFLYQVTWTWRKWLSRRHRRTGPMPWERFEQLLAHYPLPAVRVVHSIYAAKP